MQGDWRYASGAMRVWRKTEEQDGLSFGWQVVVFLAALAAIFSRLPGTLLHPQFFAEDGWVWYQQAYNLGWLRPLLSHPGRLPPDVTATGGGCDAAFSNAMGSSDHEPCGRCRSGAPRYGAAFSTLHDLGTATGAHVHGCDLHCYPERARGPHCADQCYVAPRCTTGSARILCSTLRLARTGIRHYSLCGRFDQRAVLNAFATFCGGLLLDSPATLDASDLEYYVVGCLHPDLQPRALGEARGRCASRRHTCHFVADRSRQSFF